MEDKTGQRLKGKRGNKKRKEEQQAGRSKAKYYAAAAGIPALAALYWKKATAVGMIAANIGGFIVCAIWKVLGNPLGIGGTLPGALVCAALLICVSLATYKKYPSKIA